ncbi:MAG: glycosyltransferase [Anaerolineae bacterium]|nr:glycosyltransferase [Anaerolineae bacterium]
MSSNDANIALLHDWLNQHGGAERVLEHLHYRYPAAPVYSSIYWRAKMPDAYRTWDIRTTWMDRLPGVHRHHQWYFPLYALAFARLDLGREPFDLVLSNKSGFCHGVNTGATPQLCYCLSPTRYVWDYATYAARENLSPAVKLALRPLVALLRRWDYQVAQRPATQFIAISTEIQRRIRRYYDRESQIIFPPVDVARYSLARDREDYYLIVSRLVPYKRIDLAVQAFTRLGWPLLIAGAGRDRPALENMAGPTVRFLGYVPDANLPSLLARCKAFVFPGFEDFGIAPVEAQAAGRPVIAYRAGGALDTIVEGVTGGFFEEATVDSLTAALRAFDVDAVDPLACRANAERFSVQRFVEEIETAVARILAGGLEP